MADFRTITTRLLLWTLLCAAGCTGASEEAIPPPAAEPGPRPIYVAPASHRKLSLLFAAQNYTWDNLNLGVPPLILKKLPPDLDRIRDSEERKQIFFLSLLPLTLVANEEIRQQRQDLMALLERQEKGQALSAEEKEQILDLARDYRIEENPLTDAEAREKLLRRIDTLPPSLVLAQAAAESGYGTSRFARMANNLFGEWTYKPGQGIVPQDRPEGESYEIRSFPSLYDSVRSYMNNLNSHWAYQSLRQRRAELRARGQAPGGIDLAQELTLYSERREAYVSDIETMIRRNRLSLLSTTTLRPATSAVKEPAEPPVGAGLLASSRRASRPSAGQNP